MIEPRSEISPRPNQRGLAYVAVALLTAAAFARTLRRPSLLAYGLHALTKSVARYSIVLLLFTLSLLAKPTLVTMPFLLLLLDWWPMDRWRQWRKCFVEKSSMMALAIVFCAIAVY